MAAALYARGASSVPIEGTLELYEGTPAYMSIKIAGQPRPCSTLSGALGAAGAALIGPPAWLATAIYHGGLFVGGELAKLYKGVKLTPEQWEKLKKDFIAAGGKVMEAGVWIGSGAVAVGKYDPFGLGYGLAGTVGATIAAPIAAPFVVAAGGVAGALGVAGGGLAIGVGVPVLLLIGLRVGLAGINYSWMNRPGVDFPQFLMYQNDPKLKEAGKKLKELQDLQKDAIEDLMASLDAINKGRLGKNAESKKSRFLANLREIEKLVGKKVNEIDAHFKAILEEADIKTIAGAVTKDSSATEVAGAAPQAAAAAAVAGNSQSGVNRAAAAATVPAAAAGAAAGANPRKRSRKQRGGAKEVNMRNYNKFKSIFDKDSPTNKFITSLITAAGVKGELSTNAQILIGAKNPLESSKLAASAIGASLGGAGNLKNMPGMSRNVAAEQAKNAAKLTDLWTKFLETEFSIYVAEAAAEDPSGFDSFKVRDAVNKLRRYNRQSVYRAAKLFGNATKKRLGNAYSSLPSLPRWGRSAAAGAGGAAAGAGGASMGAGAAGAASMGAGVQKKRSWAGQARNWITRKIFGNRPTTPLSSSVPQMAAANSNKFTGISPLRIAQLARQEGKPFPEPEALKSASALGPRVGPRAGAGHLEPYENPGVIGRLRHATGLRGATLTSSTSHPGNTERARARRAEQAARAAEEAAGLTESGNESESPSGSENESRTRQRKTRKGRKALKRSATRR
jgi:hypothetical protein